MHIYIYFLQKREYWIDFGDIYIYRLASTIYRIQMLTAKTILKKKIHFDENDNNNNNRNIKKFIINNYKQKTMNIFVDIMFILTEANFNGNPKNGNRYDY